MNDLLPSFRDSILSPLSDPASELLETGIDMIRESYARKELPIVSTLSAVCKICINPH